jgi:uncharacterized protein
MKIQNKPLICFLCSLSLVAVGRGQDLAKGLDAYAKKDYESALRDLLPLAKQGDPKAEFTVGLMYGNGEGVPSNFNEALRWWLLSAEHGNSEAQTLCGVVYHYSATDDKEAMKWFRRAAEQGKPWPQFVVGSMFYRGDGVPQDHKEALKWFLLAAAQGDSTAQYYVGFMYKKGEGAPQSFEEALKWLSLGAEQGNAGAQLNLGFMYFGGEGVPQNYVLGHKWSNLAAAGGDKDAIEVRDEMGVLMTPGQIAEAQRLASEWKPREKPSAGQEIPPPCP